MSAEQHDQPDYSLLTDEEIAAMKAEPSADELETMRQAREAESLEDDDNFEDDDNNPDPTDPPKSDDNPQDPPESVDPVDPPKETGQSAPKAQQTPRYEAKLPDDYTTQVDAIKAEKAALKEAYQNGDIDPDEYADKLDEINEKTIELRATKIKAEISQEMNAQTAEQQWHNTVNSFIDSVKASEAIDYHTDKAKQRDLDLFIKALANDPANEDKSTDWFLSEAHNRVKALHNVPTTTTEPPKKAETKRKPPTELIPQTLANVPGGDDASEVEGKYAALDKLDGLDLETALAKMSPEARNEYLRGD